ncbi:amino acid adenylation domain-containing protein [Nocardia sp. CDC159]|uniref:Amino acid adenylation domain-containing protein n=1 Tax=Nocardia pulmonis TaxID=2951408 RepID=A0A9X2J2Q1_9NOCA|nr:MULTISPECIES: non-ribosomal peptide synthetase [Nocardia]MCM6778271.1 amino acid adenylation domain-containing protein [Nocardia pulmonis]MCM6791160.1 amino acid adenylation domain-containing protein [Nocardia sp. CDC159]
MTAINERPATDAGRVPASPAQPGMWFASIHGPDPTAYNQPLVLRPDRLLDHDRLVAALRAVHRAHVALRTTFEQAAEGELRQVVHAELDPIVELREHPGGDAEAWVATQLAEVAGTVFDLRAGPLARVRHLRVPDANRSVLIFNIHHTVFDGMSFKPYLTQVEAAYVAPDRGPEPARQALESYARWAERCGAPETLNYWRDRLADPPARAPIGLPGDEPPRYVVRQRVLDARTTTRVREFCAAQGLTPSMFFVALAFVLLHRHTGRDDILLGIPVTVREGGDAEVLGHLTNTVVLRHRLRPGASLRDVLRTVKRDMLEALRHRHAPLAAVIGALRAGGNRDGDPFDAMITVMPWAARRLDLREWGVRTWEHAPGGAKYELAILVDETAGHFTLEVEHTTTAPGGAEFTDYLARRLETLVASALVDSEARVRDLRWISDAERHAISELCARRTAAPALGTELTADLFAATVARSGAEPAVVTDETVTSFADLAARAEAVAKSFAARGVRDGRPVAVLLRPGVDLVAVIIGILRAGGSYVNLDADLPRERLNFTLSDCGATILVCDPGIDLEGLYPPDGLAVIAAPDLTDGSEPIADQRKTPRDTAYVVYTSGTTGRPKGIAMPETTLANLVRNQALFSGGRPLRTLQYMPPAFDVFALEVFGSLCTGGTLVIPPARARTDFEALATLLADQRVERMYLPYVALRELAAVLRSSAIELPALREVVVTGERVVITEDLRIMFRRNPNARLINAYGPSEAHLCSWERLPADPGAWPALPSIGRVVAGVDAYVLDGDDRLAPFGVEGELCVAGPVVSPGYIGLPDRTRRAMVPDPFVAGQTMYRTGDAVVLTPDGHLHYRGRKDDQVKIRGYRVEPGEVVAALERELGVDAAAVIAIAAGADRVLHGFVQSAAEPPADWRTRLAAVLPDYMVPRGLTRIDAIPVTPNGKTDRRALETLLAAESGDDTTVLVGDWTDAERAVAEVWYEVLGQRPGTPDDDFFALGGHSLLAARLHRLAKQRFHAEVGLSTLLNNPTPRGMARILTGRDGAADVDLRAEAALPDLVVGPRREPADGVVLLTGATGFLGSHLLDELRRTGHRVRCLIRADSVEHGRQRLRAAFDKFALDPAGLDEVEICPGDLDRPRFGLGTEYQALAGAVSQVYHAAAHINFVVPYRTVKRTNVDGLRHLIEFCALNATPLRLISTLAVFPPDASSGVIDEDAVPGDPASLGIGYSQSKWVAEQLALRARRAGLPVTLHRVGRIGGHSRTGACRHDDFFWLQMKSFALLGRYPDEMAEAPPVDLLPVDYVARAIVRLSEAKPDNETWHLYHAEGLDWPTILDAMRTHGYALDPTDLPTWLAELERQVETGDQRAGLGPLVPFMREGVLRLGAHSFDNARSERALAELGCPFPAAEPGWIHGMFEYFRVVGAVRPPQAVPQGGVHSA